MARFRCDTRKGDVIGNLHVNTSDNVYRLAGWYVLTEFLFSFVFPIDFLVLKFVDIPPVAYVKVSVEFKILGD